MKDLMQEKRMSDDVCDRMVTYIMAYNSLPHSMDIDVLKRMAFCGDNNSLFIIGLCKYCGILTQQDRGSAIDIFFSLAKEEHAYAQWAMGMCFEDGSVVDRSTKRAVEWYEWSAQNGNIRGQYNYGRCLFCGIGVAKDYSLASKYLFESANKGDANAQYCVGNCFRLGLGLEKNIYNAVTAYRASAEQGNANAQNNLGVCYASGDGVVKNYDSAIMWFKKAIQNGCESASENLSSVIKEKELARLSAQVPDTLSLEKIEMGLNPLSSTRNAPSVAEFMAITDLSKNVIESQKSSRIPSQLQLFSEIDTSIFGGVEN